MSRRSGAVPDPYSVAACRPGGVGRRRVRRLGLAAAVVLALSTGGVLPTSGAWTATIGNSGNSLTTASAWGTTTYNTCSATAHTLVVGAGITQATVVVEGGSGGGGGTGRSIV